MKLMPAARKTAAAALVAAAAATFAPATSAEAAVHPMVAHARNYLGGWGGQCKAFVQKIHNEVYVRNLGTGYWQAYIDAGYHRVTKAEVQQGDIIQETDAATHTRGIHTAIVVSDPDGPGIRVIDSNWVGHEIVGEHTYNPTEHAQNNGGVAYYWRKG